MENNAVNYIATTTINYHLIDNPPFQYGKRYLVIDNYNTPETKCSFFWNVAGAASKSTCEIISIVPVNDRGARGFIHILMAANNFDDMIINNNLYKFSFEQLYSTYQNYVLCYKLELVFCNEELQTTTSLCQQKLLWTPSSPDWCMQAWPVQVNQIFLITMANKHIHLTSSIILPRKLGLHANGGITNGNSMP